MVGLAGADRLHGSNLKNVGQVLHVGWDVKICRELALGRSNLQRKLPRNMAHSLGRFVPSAARRGSERGQLGAIGKNQLIRQHR
jgi:hypothetical protein